MRLQRAYRWNLIWAQTPSEVLEAVKLLSKAPVLGGDTETDGLGDDANVITVQLSDGYNTLVIPAQLTELLKPLAGVPVAFHNVGFDVPKLRSMGFPVKTAYDTLLMYNWTGRFDAGDGSLKSVAQRYAGLQKVSFSETFTLYSNFKHGLLAEPEYAIKYAGWDAYITVHTFNALKKVLQSQGQWNNYLNIGVGLQEALMTMHANGLGVDVVTLESYIPIYKNLLRQLEQDIYSELGTKMNLNSSKQMGELIARLDSNPKRLASGAIATDKETLATLESQHPIIHKILLRKALSTRVNNHLKALLDHAKDGRIHPSFNPLHAQTGRLSTSEPNLQNIVKDSSLTQEERDMGISLRRAVIPAKGFMLLDTDYSQIEIRIVAALAEETTLIHAIRNGLDAHSLTASKVFGNSYEEYIEAKSAEHPTTDQAMLLQQRSLSKSLNFGIIYGMSPTGFQARANEIGLQIGLQTAKRYVDAFFNEYPAIKNFEVFCKQFAATNGYIQTALGRRRYIPYSNSPDRKLRSSAGRKAVNTPIQGTSADIIFAAMVDINNDRYLRENGVRMLHQVHDELLFELPEDTDPKVMKYITDMMKQPPSLPQLPEIMKGVPIDLDAETGSNWNEIH
jgi:DNA polymerase-1